MSGKTFPIPLSSLRPERASFEGISMRFMNRFAKAAVCTVCASLVSSMAWAGAFDLPSEGKILTGTAQQTYINQRMHDLRSGKVKITFSVTDGWEKQMLKAGSADLERYDYPAAKTNRVLLQLHGGAYVQKLDDLYRITALTQGKLISARTVYSLDYRVAPKAVYPAALEEALAAYRGILDTGAKPADIIVVGDSAGGNLALELSLALKEKGLPQPAALILQSPWTDMGTSRASRVTNFKKDLILGEGTPFSGPVVEAAYAGKLPVDDPRLSPVNADLRGLPPMLIQAGGYEVFLSEIEDFARKAGESGVLTTLTVYPGMSHDFALCLPELQESIDSMKEIRDFVNRIDRAK